MAEALPRAAGAPRRAADAAAGASRTTSTRSAAILREPDVSAWWGRYDAAEVRSELTEVRSYAIEVDGAVGGWLHVHEEADPDWPSVAFDVLVSERLRGGGYGREALRTAIRWLAEERGHHRFTIDPSVGERARDPRLRGGRVPPRRGHAQIRARRRTAAGATDC